MRRAARGISIAAVGAHLAAAAVLATTRDGTALAAVVGVAGDSPREGAPRSARHRRELDDLRRQDLAQDLLARGVSVRWEEHGLGELLDWRDRIDNAQALAADFGVTVDWRAESASALADMRLRAAKAAEMRASFGILVDWRQYGWTQLERLRTAVAAIHTTSPNPDGLAPFDPSERARPVAPNPKDPDAIFEPKFASTTLPRFARRFAARDPDGILEPSFRQSGLLTNDRTPDGLAVPAFWP